jgi:hypothetical protein
MIVVMRTTNGSIAFSGVALGSQAIYSPQKLYGSNPPNDLGPTLLPGILPMSYYADLDVSVIDELPPGRTLVLSRLLSAAHGH